MARHPFNTRFERAKLSTYPADVVTIECSTCPERFGRYKLGSLVRRLGADALLDDVYDDLIDCRYKRAPWERPPRKYEPRCLARFQEWRG